MIETVKIQGDGYLVNGTLFVPKVDGNRHYEEVKQFIADGGIVADEFTPEELEAMQLAEEVRLAKIAKEKALDELQITHETVAYDANGRSIGTMGAVVALVGYRFNQAISIGLPLDPTQPSVLTVLTPAQAYQTLYKDTRINWKGADNVKHNVMLESVCETLEKSIREVSIIIGVPQ